MFDSILYFSRKDCKYSKNLKLFLKKRTKKLYCIESSKTNEKINLNKYFKENYSYIICFRSFYILNKKLIKKASLAALNFHPGTPNFRGIGCVNYALYNKSKFYGSTCHLVEEKIDNGKILDIKKFKLRLKDTVKSTLTKTHIIMLKQAKLILSKLLKNENNLKKLLNKNKKIKWSGKLKNIKQLNQFYKIDTKISKSDFKKKVRATNTKSHKPYIILHNKIFTLSEA